MNDGEEMGSGGGDELSVRAPICLLPNISREKTSPYWHTNDPAVAVFMSIFFVVALVLNSFILYTMVGARSKLLRAPTHIVLFSLAVSDLLLAVLVMPVSVISNIFQDYPFGSSDYIRCKVCQHGCIFSILSISSTHHIALLSLDRFLFIYLPITYKTRVTRSRMIAVLLIVWFIATIIGIMPLFGFGAIGYSNPVGTCVVLFYGRTHLTKNINYVMLFFVEMLIPITVIVVCNIGLLCTARKHLKKHRMVKKQMYATSNPDSNVNEKAESQLNREYLQQQIQLFHVFAAIFIGNMITWLPVLGLAVVSRVVNIQTVPPESIAFVFTTYISYALIHPILESWFIVDIRVRAKKILSKLGKVFLLLCNKQNSEGNSACRALQCVIPCKESKVWGSNLQENFLSDQSYTATSTTYSSDTAHSTV